MAGLACACADAPGPLHPASRGLVLVQLVDGQQDIVRVRIADGATRAVTATPRREERWPYWSRVVDMLVFQIERDSGDSDLVIWSEDEGEKPVTRSPAREERWPAWSPTAPHLLYVFRGVGRRAGLTLLHVGTGKQRDILTTGVLDLFLRPTFSPDGKQVVMQRRDAKGQGSNLWLDGGGERPRRLTADASWFDYKPSFSRDGAWVFYSRKRGAGGRSEVARIAARGGAPKPLAKPEDSDEHSARTSPTRDEIAFVSDRDGTPGVFLAELPEGGARRLSPRDRVGLAPRWSPDGERLAVTTVPIPAPGEPFDEQERLRETRVLVLDRSGRVLVDVPGFMPDWMPAWP